MSKGTFKLREPIVCDAHHGQMVMFSPDGQYIATLASSASIEIRTCISLQVMTCIECPADVNSFYWAPDSKLLLVLMKSLNSLQIYFVEQTKVDENHLTSSYAGISGGSIDTENILWSPDSNFVLIFSIHAAALYAWDIVGRSIRKLPSPKNTQSSVSYSPTGNYLAILTHEGGKELLLILDSQSFRRKMSFNLSTLDSTTVKWTEDGQKIYVIDSISHHLLQIVNLKNQTIFDHSAYDGFLGITEATACQNSKIIAVGGYDDYVRLLVFDGQTWKILTEWLHEVSIGQQSLPVYIENGNSFDTPDSNITLKQSGDNGIKSIKWSIGNKYLASISNQTPSALYIWDAETISLFAVIILMAPIRKFEWSPKEESLLISSGSGFIAHWSPAKIEMIKSIDLMRVQDFFWRNDGKAFLILDKEAGTVALAM